MTIFQSLAYRIDRPALLKEMRADPETAFGRDLLNLIDEAEQAARPKGVFQTKYLETEGNDLVRIGGQTFRSRVLKVNLEKAHRVFPLVVTCGRELEDWSASVKDMLKSFWADAILNSVLRSAAGLLIEEIGRRFSLEKTSLMTPGSLPDWPLEEQRPLFTLIGGDAAEIGVEINDSLLMIPTHSISGILFPTEIGFASCQMCPRERCPGRRAPYDPDLAAERYGLENH